MQVRAVIAALLTVLVLAGCSVSGGKSPIPTPTLSSAAPTEKADSWSFEGPKSEATTEPMDVCSDSSGDGGPADIQDVTLYASEVEVSAMFEMTKPLPKTSMLGIYVSSADGQKIRLLGVKWVNGKTRGPFIHDFGSAKQDNLASDKVQEKGSQWIMAIFPASSVSDLGKGWRWSAIANAASTATDACPGPTGAMQYQPFAGRTERVDLD